MHSQRIRRSAHAHCRATLADAVAGRELHQQTAEGGHGDIHSHSSLICIVVHPHSRCLRLTFDIDDTCARDTSRSSSQWRKSVSNWRRCADRRPAAFTRCHSPSHPRIRPLHCFHSLSAPTDSLEERLGALIRQLVQVDSSGGGGWLRAHARRCCRCSCGRRHVERVQLQLQCNAVCECCCCQCTDRADAVSE